MLLNLYCALKELAMLMPNGDETMIKDNANYPSPIWTIMEQIDSSEDEQKDYAVNMTGIYKINQYGQIEGVPVFRVV